MKQHVVGAVSAAALVLTCLVAPAAAQQAQFPRFNALDLVGPGSTIGLSIDEVGAEEATKAKLSQPEGVVVRTVQDGSPAARAGFKAGDVVVEFDGERVRSSRHFVRLVQETPPNRAVKATVVRDGARQTLNVTPELGRASIFPGDNLTNPKSPTLRVLPAPQGSNQFRFSPDSPFVVTPSQGRLGAMITTVDGQLAEYFGVKGGALVTSVNADSPAATSGLKAGDVITRIAGRDVGNPTDVTEAVRAAQAGSSIDLTVVRDKKTLQLKATLPVANQPQGGAVDSRFRI